MEENKYALSLPQRLILVNQYKILKCLTDNVTEQQDYDNLITALENGYELHYQDCDFDKFSEDLENLIIYLKQFSNKIVLETIFYSVMPQNMFVLMLEKFGLMKEKYDNVINHHKDRKNKIIKEIANKTGCDFCDINTKMLHTKYIHKDHIHYEPSARNVITSILSEYVTLA